MKVILSYRNVLHEVIYFLVLTPKQTLRTVFLQRLGSFELVDWKLLRNVYSDQCLMNPSLCARHCAKPSTRVLSFNLTKYLVPTFILEMRRWGCLTACNFSKITWVVKLTWKWIVPDPKAGTTLPWPRISLSSGKRVPSGVSNMVS